MAIEKVLVVGLGLMGSGIAQVCAQAGLTTFGYDVSPEAVKGSTTFVAKDLDKRVEKGKLTPAEKDAILSRLKPVKSLEEARDVDLVIEAVNEDVELKKKVFSELGKVIAPHALFGSNTSALPATPLAAASGRPAKFMIIHFHQPPTAMKLVELVRALQTSDETAKEVISFCQKIGKTPVEIKSDCPGFLTNRTMVPLLNEVYYCLYEGICSKEDIDIAFKLGFNWPMGPLELSDFIGLDTMLHILEDLNKRRGGDKYIPCPLLSNMVAAGYLGRKSGRGFYDYSVKS